MENSRLPGEPVSTLPKARLSNSASGEFFAATSLLQAIVRRWLMGKLKRRFRSRARVCRAVSENARRRFMWTVRSKAFMSMVSCATHRLACLRAEVTAGRGHAAATLALQCASKALNIAVVGHSHLLRAEAGARWITEYVAERAAMPAPSHLRKLLARDWNNLDDDTRYFYIALI